VIAAAGSEKQVNARPHKKIIVRVSRPLWFFREAAVTERWLDGRGMYGFAARVRRGWFDGVLLVLYINFSYFRHPGLPGLS
jgi:hypothetical protein